MMLHMTYKELQDIVNANADKEHPRYIVFQNLLQSKIGECGIHAYIEYSEHKLFDLAEEVCD